MSASVSPIFSLGRKVALVTGAAGLLGRRHCAALAEAGASVAAVDLDRASAESMAQEVAAKYGTVARGFAADITNPDSLADLDAAVRSALGPVDVLVNNAAIDDKVPAVANGRSFAFEHYPLDAFQRSLHTNVTGTFLCCQTIGRGMAERGRGSIINIASTYGVVAPDQSLYRKADGTQTFFKGPAYPTSKGAVLAFTRFLAAYWGSKGVRVNALSPGGVENGQDPEFVERYRARTPLGRMATPDDYQGALVFLASDASAYMTGANLVVDGGWTAW